jgi:hypothetical protein
MGKPIKLSAKLPGELAMNGLDTVHDQLAGYGTAYVIMSVSTYEVLKRLSGDVQPVMVIEHIEGLPEGPLAVAAKQLMRDARKAREIAVGVIPGLGTDDLSDSPTGDDGDVEVAVEDDEPHEGGMGAAWDD